MYAQRRGWASADTWTHEQEDYDGLRELLAPQYAALPAAALDAQLESILGEMSPDDIEDFWQSVKSFGQQAMPVLQRALPGVLQGAVSGATTGATMGGPWGALVGGVAGGALGGAQSAQRRPATAGARAAQASPGPAAPHGAASPAAAQLLQLINRPEVQQALLSMVMGPAGNRNVSAGGTPIPVGAIANTLGVLANQAAAEHHQVVTGDGGGTPLYLLDDAGEFVCDVANPAERAGAVLSHFAAADAAESGEDEEQFESDDDLYVDPVAELDSLYDDLELAELAAEDEE